jgi:4-alpha-glucanotransferase
MIKFSTRAAMIARAAGILLHPTSLPGRYGVGDLGDELIAFLDWIASAGQKIWQILPVTPPGHHNSPYSAFSSFAGNSLLISPKRLLDDNLLPPKALMGAPIFPSNHVDFEGAAKFKTRVLRLSHAHFTAHATAEQRDALAEFVDGNHQECWLDDWALFIAIKQHFHEAKWAKWDAPLAEREPHALARARNELADEIRFYKYVQFLFFSQWRAVKDAAHARGIRILGDVPIYVGEDSADVWSSRNFFQLDESGVPTAVAGVPADGDFSLTGQRWGNPLYRWEEMRGDGYRWWINRVRAALSVADIVRLDHFCGFEQYWEISATEPSPDNGFWRPGPGLGLFTAFQAAFGVSPPFVAEDLGFRNSRVDDLRRAVGFPGMSVLQFAFRKLDSPHLPHSYEPDTIVYTGTHDNDTVRGWYEGAQADERRRAELYLGSDGSDIAWAMIRATYTSVAQFAIIPLQDILGLGTEARMNRPGQAEDNWHWRYRADALNAADAARIRNLVEVSARF